MDECELLIPAFCLFLWLWVQTFKLVIAVTSVGWVRILIEKTPWNTRYFFWKCNLVNYLQMLFVAFNCLYDFPWALLHCLAVPDCDNWPTWNPLDVCSYVSVNHVIKSKVMIRLVPIVARQWEIELIWWNVNLTRLFYWFIIDCSLGNFHTHMPSVSTILLPPSLGGNYSDRL